MAAQSLFSSTFTTFKKYADATAGNRPYNPNWALHHNTAAPSGGGLGGVAVDSLNLYTSMSLTGHGAVLLKSSILGEPIWQRKLSDATLGTFYNCVAVDSASNVIAAGSAAKSGITYRGLIAKYNSSGVLQWQRTLDDNSVSSNSTAAVNGIATDSSNNIYVTGRYNYSSSFYGAYVVKYNSSGVLQWQKTLTDAATNKWTDGYGIAVDSSGNIYVTGRYTAASNGAYTIFLAKLDSAGSSLWQRSLAYGTTSGNIGFAIALDSLGNNIYITGYCNNNSLMFVAKYNSSASLQWQRISSTTQSGGFAIALDSSDNVYMTGQASGFGINAPLVKMSSTNGAVTWGRQVYDVWGSGSSSGTVFRSMAFSSAINSVIVNGVYKTRTPGNAAVNSQLTLAYPTAGDKGGTAAFDVNKTVTFSGFFNPATHFPDTSGLTDSTAPLTLGTGSLTDAAGTRTEAALAINSLYSGLTTAF